jgi:CubicO group peptidase (beta-lactamase class C family)
MLRTKNLYIAMMLTIALCVSCTNAGKPQSEIDTNILNATLSELVEDGSVMGAAALIYKNGEEIYYGDFGLADKEAEQVWQRDTLATLHSMTKPVTGVTLMSLYEDGLFDFQDPLSKYLPEYADVKVFAGENPDGTLILETPHRPLKVIDIFRHTACFGYGWEGSPVAARMNEADLFNPEKPLSQFSEELAKIPLYCQPGTQWKYGVAVDVQARLAEVLTQRPFEDLVKERVLGPLDMYETTYFVERDNKPRLAATYLTGEEGKLTRRPNNEIYSFRTIKPIQINGGHGLISTIDDYMRFALMLQNEGTLDGIQILKPETIRLMSKDHLPADLTAKDFLPSKGQMGFGLNFAVRIAPPLDENEPYGVVGEFFWDGAASTLFWVDPKNDLTVVFLIQSMPFNQSAQTKFRKAVYEALAIKKMNLPQ